MEKTLSLLDLIAHAENYNKRYKVPPITDIFYDLKNGMVTLNFFGNMFSIAFHKYEIKNYSEEYVESILNEIVEKINSGQLRKDEYYDGFD